MATPSAKHPPPPKPWKARNTVLDVVSLFECIATSTHNCTNVCDAPHAAEKAMNRNNDIDTMTLRPKMSLNFAAMTRKPAICCE